MKKVVLKVWPLLFIFAVWLIFISPIIVKNKTPFPSTYLVENFGPWNEYVEYSGIVKNTATPDVITQILPWKKQVVEVWKSGYVPLWNPYLFAGTPLLANYQSAALSPINVIYFMLPFMDAWALQVVLQPLLAGLFVYLFVRSLKISKTASVVAAISFMFCGFLTSWMVYGLLGYAILFLPLALYAIEKFYEKHEWYFLVLLSLSIPLSLFSGHFQTSIYLLGFVAAYSIFKVIQTKDLRVFILNILAFVFGLLISMPQLLPSVEFYGESVRSVIFQKTEVIPWNYLPTFLAPDFFGNPVTRNQWFGHYAEWNAYTGLIPLILAFYALRRKSSYVIFFVITAVVTILFAFQTPILDLLIFLKIPVLSTSAASRIIVLFSFSIAVLAALGLDDLILEVQHKGKKNLFAILLIAGLGILSLWVIVLFKLFIPQENIPIALSNLRLPTAIYLVFSVISIIFIIFRQKRIKYIFLALVLLLVTFDMLRFSMKWQPYDPKELIYPNTPMTKTLDLMKGSRQFGNFGQESSQYFEVGSLEGYDPLYIGRYGEFIGAGVDGMYHNPERSVVSLSKNGSYTGKILNFMGVKYIVHKIADGHNIWAFPFWEYSASQFRTIYQDDKYQILVNNEAQPKAFVVSGVEIEANKKSIIKKIFKQNLDLSKTAIVEESLKSNLSKDATGSGVINSYMPNRIEVETNTDGAMLLVLTDPYYPGWEALVDGSMTNIYRTDYAFRGIVIPAGKHKVVFTYNPNSLKMGIGLGLIGVLGVAGESIYIWKKKYQS